MEVKHQKVEQLRNRIIGSATWRNLRGILSETWHLIRSEWRLVLPFLLIYSVFNMLATLVIVEAAIRSAMALCGITYIFPR